ARTRPEAAHAPGVCQLAVVPLVGPLLALAHAREVDARAAQTTTAAGRTVWKTTPARAPVSSENCSTAAGRRSGNPWAASEGRCAGPRGTRWTDHLGSRRRTARDSQDAAVAAGGAARADGAARSTVRDRRTGRTAAAAARSGV